MIKFIKIIIIILPFDNKYKVKKMKIYSSALVIALFLNIGVEDVHGIRIDLSTYEKISARKGDIITITELKICKVTKKLN